MAIERMSVAKISGKLDMFDKTLDEICAAGIFQPENAESFYSAGMGLKPFDGDNTAAGKISELEMLAKNAGIKLHVREHDAPGDDTPPDGGNPDDHGAAEVAPEESGRGEECHV